MRPFSFGVRLMRHAKRQMTLQFACIKPLQRSSNFVRCSSRCSVLLRVPRAVTLRYCRSFVYSVCRFQYPVLPVILPLPFFSVPGAPSINYIDLLHFLKGTLLQLTCRRYAATVLYCVPSPVCKQIIAWEFG